jgi:porin
MTERYATSMPKALAVTLVMGCVCNPAALAEDQAAPAPGLLPIPEYSGDFSSRSHLLGDLGGARTEWAQKGFQFDIDLVQWAESVVDGGTGEDEIETGGNATYNLEWDLLRAGFGVKGLIQVRAESRWGDSAIFNTGLVVPNNTAGLTPTNYSEFDDGYDIALTQFSYLQFLNEHWGFIVGKLDLFADGDANEFATGRGRTQFNHWSINYPTGVLLVPASTIGAGLIYEPSHDMVFTTSVISGTECVRNDCFNDLDDSGYISATTASFQFNLNGLPGGFTGSYIHFFDFDFTDLNEITISPGEGLVGSEKDHSWLASGSFWQYLSAEGAHEGPINVHDRLPDLQGWGFFGRFTFADEDVSPWQASVSLGIGGRGLFQSRPDDLFGVGYFYNDLSTDRFLPDLGYEDKGEGFEAFYNFAITKSVRFSTNLQYLEWIVPPNDDAVVVSGRLQIIL